MLKKTSLVFGFASFLLCSRLDAVIIRVTRMENEKTGARIRLWGDMHRGRTAFERRFQLRKMAAVASALARNKAKKVVFLLELPEANQKREKSMDFSAIVSRLKTRKYEAITKAVKGALAELPESTRDKALSSKETQQAMLSYAAHFIFSGNAEGLSIGGYPTAYGTFDYLTYIIPKSRNISTYRLDSDRLEAFNVLWGVNKGATLDIYTHIFKSSDTIKELLSESFNALIKMITDLNNIAQKISPQFRQECKQMASKIKAIHDRSKGLLKKYLSWNLKSLGDLYFKGLLVAVALGKQDGYSLLGGKESRYFKDIIQPMPIDAYIKLREMKRAIITDTDLCKRVLDLKILNQFMQEKDAKEFVIIAGAEHTENLAKDFQKLGYKTTFDSKIRDKKGNIYNSAKEKGFHEMIHRDAILPVKLSAFSTKVDKKSEGLFYKVINDLRFAAEDVKTTIIQLNRKFGPRAVFRRIVDGIASGIYLIGWTEKRLAPKQPSLRQHESPDRSNSQRHLKLKNQ